MNPIDTYKEIQAMKKNDGGSAFPLPVHISSEGHEHVAYEGITMRDYFAIRCKSQFDFTGTPESRAVAAYAEADAMLKARES